MRRRALEQPPTRTGLPGPSPGGEPAPEEFPLALVADDDVAEVTRARAREAIARVARAADHAVVRAQVSLHVSHDPALARPAVVKATIQAGPRPVRAHVAAGTLSEAIDLVARRLRRKLERLEELERSRRHESGIAEPGEWRHRDLPIPRPEHYPRPAEERELVRRKTFALEPLTPEQAMLEMELLDHDFYLFTSAETGDESVVYRRSDGTIALAATRPAAGGAHTQATDPVEAPLLFLEQAIERLDTGGEPFVFFVDPQTKRGRLLYLRYDGHYGLIEPAVEEPAA